MNSSSSHNERIEQQKKDLEEHKKMLMESISLGSKELNPFSGIDNVVKEELKETTKDTMSVPSPLAGMDPNDPGVPIQNLFPKGFKFNIK
jgi:hypothetical protein